MFSPDFVIPTGSAAAAGSAIPTAGACSVRIMHACTGMEP